MLFARHKAALELKGEPARGAATFQKLCSACHKTGGRGAEVGPDLATVANHTREQVLRDIIYPSLAVAPQYHQFIVGTADGRIITGLVASSSSTSYTIRRQGGEEVIVLRMDVEELRDTQVSLMPENLLVNLAAQDVADLLDFVRKSERPGGSARVDSPAGRR